MLRKLKKAAIVFLSFYLITTLLSKAPFCQIADMKSKKESALTKRDEAVIKKVIDGDTFDVIINGKTKRIRLIGVDTPESVATKKNLVNTKYGKKASDYAKKRLPKGTKISLLYDKEKKDVYGRALVYLYLNNGTELFQRTLLQKGYARAVYYSPNDKYRKEFARLHKEAKKKKKGFWKTGFSKAFPTKKEKEY